MGMGIGISARNESRRQDVYCKIDLAIGRGAKEALFIDTVDIAVGNPPALLVASHR